MSKNQKKKKISWQQYTAVAFSMLAGAACGAVMVQYTGQSRSGRPLSEILFSLAGLLLGMYAAILLQLIIHEAGHLVFGLLSGYQFSSFRIFSYMWIKEDGRLKFRRLSIAGTGGQCLMVPPDFTDGRIPAVLYNLGGSLMNILTGLFFLKLHFTFQNMPYLSVIMLLLAVTGFLLAIMNGVPMRMGTVDNDGYNAFSLTRNSRARRSFWVQMKANEQMARGVRLKDMPDEWFAVPSDEAMKNSMAAAVGVFACSRLMDAHRFEDADRLMAHLLEIDSGIIGLHRSMMVCDRIYCELITENRREILDGMFDQEQKKFMKQMKNYPSVLRTEYAYALLCEKDTAKAGQAEERFEKCAAAYPYPGEIQSERELMEIARGRSSLNAN